MGQAKMTTINLYQPSQKENQAGNGFRIGGNFVFSLGILIVTLLALGGLKIAVMFLNDRNDTISKELIAQKSSISGQENIQHVLDVQTRLAQVKINLDMHKNYDTNGIITNLGAEMANGVVVSSFSNTNKKLDVIFDGTNFSDISKQLYNLRNSKNFTNVNLKGITRNEKGISMEIEMELQPKETENS